MSTDYIAAGKFFRDHTLSVPLDWANPGDSPRISIFVREVSLAKNKNRELPLLLFLQGGPGGKGPRPVGSAGWLDAALERYTVVLLDQRGTGRSTPVTAATMERFDTAHQGAEYLLHFRADSIIHDAEHVRHEIYASSRWATLGQSYGGFLTLSYLSMAPEALTACHITGGLPSLEPSAAGVYARTYPRTAAKTAQFYELYPHHVDTAARIADLLETTEVRLPDGDRLSVRRFQCLGIDFGMKPGFERLNALLDEALTGHGLSDVFLAEVQARTAFAGNPLFAVMQESIYGHGSHGATGWAAQAEIERHPEFDSSARPLMFTGEMMYPWMFAETRLLRPFKGAVDLLAEKTDWSSLYDSEKLAANTVPVAAIVYHDDMYVDAGLSLAAASKVGNLHAWVTNEFEHDGLGSGTVLPRLFAMIDELGGPLQD